MNPQALNRYSYCYNNPLKYVDPTGHSGLLAALTRIIGELIGYGVTEAAGANVSGTSFDEFLCSMDPRTQEYWQNLVLYGATAGIGSYTFGATRGAIRTESASLKNIPAKVSAETSAIAPTETTRVFYSGGMLAEKAAETFAKQNGGTTIGMTPVGQQLNQITKGMDYPTQARPLWEIASKQFAQDASGEVHVFQNALGVSRESIWATIEYPTLINNLNVSKIIYHTVMPDGSIAISP